MAEHNELGIKGERLALEYLSEKGYEICAQNYRFNKAELDIIAEYEDQLIVVEVKTRQSDYLTDPSELISSKKQADIIRAANHYINENEIDLECRFDVIIIVLNSQKMEIRHIEDAFFPEV